MEQKMRRGMAGHTMTLLGERSKLLVVGGISAEGDFSDSVLEYDLERDWWAAAAATAASGVGGFSVYGHSAVLHAPSESVYVFGGVVEGQNSPSGWSNRILHAGFDIKLTVGLLCLNASS